MSSKEKFPREVGFLRGLYIMRKWGLEIFWGKCLITYSSSEKVGFIESSAGRIVAIYILPLSSLGG